MLDINKELEKFNELLRDEDDLTRSSRNDSAAEATGATDHVRAKDADARPSASPKRLNADSESTQSARESKVVHRPIVTAKRAEDREAMPPVSSILDLGAILNLDPLEIEADHQLAELPVSDEAKSVEAHALLAGARGALRTSIVRESKERESRYRKRVTPLAIDTSAQQGVPADWDSNSTADRLDVVFGYAATLSGWAKSPAVYAVAACLALVAVAGSVFAPFGQDPSDFLTANSEAELADNRVFFGDMLEVNETVELALITEPDGAAVYIDGEYVGLSPIMSLPWAAGTSTIYIAKEDYASIDSVVVLAGNRLMAFTMDPLDGEIPVAQEVEADRGLGIDLLVTDGPPASPKAEVADLNARKTELVIETRAEATADAKLESNRPQRDASPSAGALQSQTQTNESRVSTAPAVAPVEAATGSLILTSQPSGAEVVIDGSPIGRTPLTLDGVSLGARQIVFKQDGYESFATAVDVGASIRTPLHAVLEGRPGILVITMNAPGKVYVDGALRTPEETNIAEVKIGAGRHDVLAINSTYGEKESIVRVGPDSRTDLSIDFISGPFGDALKEGDRLSSSGDLDRAVVAYNKALAIKPEDTTTRDKLGNVERLIAERERNARLSKTVIQDGVYLVADEMPQLIGGLKKLHESVRYPEAAYQAGVQGRVYIDLVIDEKGRVRDANITRGIGFGCDEEAQRAVKKARFTPGKVNGVAVPVRQSLFVNFQIK